MKIPKQFNVGGQTIKVVYVDKQDGTVLGDCCLGASVVRLYKTFNGQKQSLTSMENTFLHEMTHVILETMGRFDLSDDEKFVCSFSSFLNEAINSMK